MSEPIKHHYVPQTYLKYFTDNSNNLNIYVKNKDQIIKQTPRNAGYQKHFYTLENNGEKDYSIEKMLAEHVDTLYKPIIEKIENQESLSKADVQNLAIFITFQSLRTPAHRKNYNGMIDDFYKQTSKIIFGLKKAHNQLGDLKSEEIEQIEHFLENENYEVQVPKEHSLESMLKYSEEMSVMLSNHNFLIVKASSKSEFITSDNPYCMVKEDWSPNWSGYGILNTSKYFPLTPRYLLALQGQGGNIGYSQLSKEQVRHMNFLIALQSDKFLYSSNEYLLKSLVGKIKKQLNQ